MANGGLQDWVRAFPIDIKSLYEKADEPLPHSAKRWWWCWGGLVGLLFLLQAATGLLLAMYYRAEPETAYQSVAFITEQARYGRFIRSVHQWAGSFMIVLLFLHMLRVFVTGAYRQYRWGAWMTGVGLLGSTLGLAFTGYSLLYEQLSYWAITVTSNIMSSVPWLGGTLKRLFLAGDEINAATLSRMYALHVQILPAALVGIGVLHLFFVRLLGLHVPGNDKDQEEEKATTAREGVYHFFPDHVASEVAVFLYLVLVISLLAIAVPAVMGAPADPLVTPEHIKPEWYFYPSFHLLKLVPGNAGVIIMGAVGLTLFLWPILDQYVLQRIDRVFKGRIEVGLVLGLIVIGLCLAWTVAEAIH
ncbi:MAG: cytochrome bc complex cytochrome b subunit [Armatimonadota bacterium]|jgi:quinol-cytochrome oxidoreductase complex cytochrome b subunit